MKSRSCKIKSFLGDSNFFSPTTNLLPYGDMVNIMQKLLEMPNSKVHELAINDEAPTFIKTSAKLLNDNRLGEYMDTFRKCQEMSEKGKR